MTLFTSLTEFGDLPRIFTWLSIGSAFLITDPDKIYEYFVDKHFKDSADEWSSLGLKDIWDKREFIALNFNPYQKLYVKDCHTFDFDFFELPAQAAWLSLDIYIKDILDYCNLELNNVRFKNWQQVYNQWKQLHHDRIKFCWFLKFILKSVFACFS